MRFSFLADLAAGEQGREGGVEAGAFELHGGVGKVEDLGAGDFCVRGC